MSKWQNSHFPQGKLDFRRKTTKNAIPTVVKKSFGNQISLLSGFPNHSLSDHFCSKDSFD